MNSFKLILIPVFILAILVAAAFMSISLWVGANSPECLKCKSKERVMITYVRHRGTVGCLSNCDLPLPTTGPIGIRSKPYLLSGYGTQYVPKDFWQWYCGRCYNPLPD
jgi:hypothetical protein